MSIAATHFDIWLKILIKLLVGRFSPTGRGIDVRQHGRPGGGHAAGVGVA